MTKRNWLVPLAALALASSSLTSVAGPAAASVRSPSQVSGGAAGYLAIGASGAFTSVSSDWTQPTAHCTSGGKYASFMVGLDGYTSDTMEMIGADADCDGKTPLYYAWYEMYPANVVTFSSTINPGDQLAASVTYHGSSKFTLKISDSAQGWSHTVQASLADAARSSAEVLLLSPSGSLTDFGSVTFTGAMVNKADLCDSDPVKVTVTDVIVSAISGCTSFTDTETKAVGTAAMRG
ncbi:MAG: G1 family glutamic endopeptidase [Streptosporangiaceae bacterium]